VHACSFETAEEEDAYETLCAAEKGLVTKWTCKTVQIETHSLRFGGNL
jgi:hypothetical protein